MFICKQERHLIKFYNLFNFFYVNFLKFNHLKQILQLPKTRHFNKLKFHFLKLSLTFNNFKINNQQQKKAYQNFGKVFIILAT
jgi:hypothetical protein